MDVYIAEKPSLGRLIAAHLDSSGTSKDNRTHIVGDGWVVTWCFGHLYELIPPGKYKEEWNGSWSLSQLPIIPDELIYEPKESAKAQIKVIHGLCKNATALYNVGDPDREGDALVNNVITRAPFNGPVFRVWPDDLSPTGLIKVFKRIKPIGHYAAITQSALSRSKADWLVGMNFTRLYTCLGNAVGAQGVISLGRVQTVVFALIYERCMEIENFKAISHFGASAKFKTAGGNYEGTFVARPAMLDESGYLTDKSIIERVVREVSSAAGVIKSVNKELVVEKTAIPFSLSKLQVFASKKWGYTSKEVISACQYLYEDLHALSYPRSSCGYLNEGDFPEVPLVVEIVKKTIDIGNFEGSLNYKDMPRCFDDSKTEAHTGIIPTQTLPDYSRFEALSSKDKKSKKIGSVQILKDIYWAASFQYLKQFMPHHEYEHTKIVTDVNQYEFNTTGKVIKVVGWKELEPASKKKMESPLPVITSGESSAVLGVDVASKKTKPPEYFQDGTLIAAMTNIANYISDPEAKKRLKDTAGIGTDATRADMIEKIKSVGYVYLDGSAFKVTQFGRDIFKSFPPYFKTASMTAIWETALDRIATGHLDHNKFNSSIVAWVNTNVAALLESPPEIKITINSKYKCGKCSKPLLSQKGKYGVYWGCSDRACKTTYKEFQKAPLFPIDGDGVKCEKCEDGTMQTRATKGSTDKPAKVFLGCTNFPKCSNSVWPK